VRSATAGVLLILAVTMMAVGCQAGIPVAGTSTLWAEPDTMKLSDTTTVYVIIRDVYGEPIDGLACSFYSDRGDTDVFIGSPDTTGIDGAAQARLTSNQFNFWPNVPHVAHVTVECEGVIIGPISVYWRSRAGVDGTSGSTFALYQNAPNPFGKATEVGYAAARPSKVSLVVYDVLGKQVRALVDASVGAGYHRAAWDGNDDAGRALSAGTYYVHMEAPGFSETRSLVLLR
jgi:hypothetical protein